MIGCLRSVGLASSDVSALTLTRDEKCINSSGALVFKLAQSGIFTSRNLLLPQDNEKKQL